jgi:hypothetical protein
VIGYNGNGSRGLVRYNVDWAAFLKNDCPYILTVVLRTRLINRQNGDFLLLASGFNGNNYTSGFKTEKQSSQVIGILKNYNSSKVVGTVLSAYISYKNGFRTYLQKRPTSNFFEIEILTMDGQPIAVTPNPFEYNLIMNFKEVNPAVPKTISPKRHQLTFYSDNAINSPLATLGTLAIFNVDWSFLEDRPYLMTIQFYTQLNALTPLGQLCHFCNIGTLNTISNNLFTNGKIMNQNTSLIGISRHRSYQDDGQAQLQSDVDDNPPSTILTRPKSNRFEFYNTGYQLNLPSATPNITYRFILSFTEL